MATSDKATKREVRRRRIRASVSGTATKPRLSVFKSNKYMYAQLIDDTTGTTLVSSSGLSMDKKTPAEQADLVGAEIAQKALDKKITEAVFDRSGYLYTGRVKRLAESARKAGLNF